MVVKTVKCRRSINFDRRNTKRINLSESIVSRRLGATGWSDPSGKLPCHFGPPLVRGAGTAPPRWSFSNVENTRMQLIYTFYVIIAVGGVRIPFAVFLLTYLRVIKAFDVLSFFNLCYNTLKSHLLRIAIRLGIKYGFSQIHVF